MLDSESVAGGGAPQGGPSARPVPKGAVVVDEAGRSWSGGLKKKRRGSASSSASCVSGAAPQASSWLLAVLCLVSLASSGYFGYRETVLEARLGELERRLDDQGLQAAFRADQYPGVIVERLRRDVEQRLARRLPRAAPPREGREGRDRIYARSAGDCTCPSGE